MGTKWSSHCELGRHWQLCGNELDPNVHFVVQCTAETATGGLAMPESTRLTAAAKEVREFAKIGLRNDNAQRRIRLLERAPILRNLPAVKAAGENSTPQFEYLVQAIIDVIDSIDGQVGAANLTGSEEITTSRRLEADALRTLFGLTEHSRRTTWQKRQEDAARTLSISWEHFRKNTQCALLCAIAEQLLLTVDTKRRAPNHLC
jgi:hypothetical protein